jgi:hypothetical protein
MHKQSPEKTGHLSPDLDIQPDFFKIMHKRPAIFAAPNKEGRSNDRLS